MTAAFTTTNDYTVLVDDADLSEATRHAWQARKPPKSRSCYVERREYDPVLRRGRLVYLHRQLLDAPPDTMVDHINGDPLDNRRANLRLCSNRQNQQNQQVRTDNKSGYRGVGPAHDTRFYRADIRIDGKKRYLGQYATARDAALAFDRAAEAAFGEYARLNLPDCRDVPARVYARHVIGAKDGQYGPFITRARGYRWDPRCAKWVARVQFNGERFFLGRFEHEHEAARAVAAKREELRAQRDATFTAGIEEVRQVGQREHTLHGASDTLMEVLVMTDAAIARGRYAVAMCETSDPAMEIGRSAIELAQAVRAKVLEAQQVIKLHELRVKQASDVLLYGQPTRELARELARCAESPPTGADSSD